MGPEWKLVTVDGFEQTYINLNNVCGLAWDGSTTTITFVDGTKVYASEQPQDIFEQRFKK